MELASENCAATITPRLRNSNDCSVSTESVPQTRNGSPGRKIIHTLIWVTVQIRRAAENQLPGLKTSRPASTLTSTGLFRGEFIPGGRVFVPVSLHYVS